MTHLTPRQRLERVIGRVLLRLPHPLLGLLNGPPVVRDGLTLDRQLQLLLRLQKRAGNKPWYLLPVAQARKNLEMDSAILAPDPPALAAIVDLELAGGAGPIAARLYRPKKLRAPAPALVYFHGGGFVLGSLASHDEPCRLLAASSGCVVIAVDYRLAPEHPFPAAPKDCIAAFRSVVAKAADLGIDPRRIAVGGDSAGGNLATVVAQQTRKDPVRPCFQLLIYPTTDTTMSFPSIQTMASGFLLEKLSMDWFMKNYLPPGQDRQDPLASPLYGDPAGLPPALVQTAGFDPLRDEGEAYAEKMRAAGVAVEVRRYDPLIHGFFNLSGAVRAARDAVDDAAAALSQAFLKA